MSKSKTILLTAVAFSIGALMQSSPTTAAPAANLYTDASVSQNNLDLVRYYGGGWHGGGWRGGYWRGGGGWGWGGYYAGGLAAGAIIGGMLAAPYYYPGPYYYGYGPPATYGGPPDDGVAYCMQRFKSYDPGSGTYLGYDGYRHPCP